MANIGLNQIDPLKFQQFTLSFINRRNRRKANSRLPATLLTCLGTILGKQGHHVAVNRP